MTREHESRGIAGRSTLTASGVPPTAQVGRRTLTEAIVYDAQPHAPRAPTTTAGAPTQPDTTRQLVEDRASPPVQRSARGLPFLQLKGNAAAPVAGTSSDQETAAVHASAQRGIATSASPLPHLDTIQRAFGRHDVSGIQAHMGADAAASAREMGAQAYATGQHVVLGAGAELYTVAHEAAHVVQQRGGVQLKGGVGSEHDAYERHADAVADRVVRGDSAERLLDEHAGARGEVAVQRKLSFDQPSITYGPKDQPLEALHAVLEQHHVTLDSQQHSVLGELFSTGSHRFATLDALLEECFGMIGGLQPATQTPDGGRVSHTEQSGDWFVSNNTGSLDHGGHFADASRRVKLQLAACGGEMYRALLGGPQPKVLTGVCNQEEVRASQSVPGRMAWPVHNGQSDKGSRGYKMLMTGNAESMAQPAQQVSISGLLSVYVTAMFLGDLDLNDDNLSAVLDGSTLRALKIDSEACFSPFFFGSDGDLNAALANPTLAQKHQMNYTFADNVCRALAADDSKIIALLHSPAAIQEKYTTIKRILEFGADSLIAIMNRFLSEEFASVKKPLNDGIRGRILALQTAATALPGYSTFAASGVAPGNLQLPDELMTPELRDDIEDDDAEEEEEEEGAEEGEDRNDRGKLKKKRNDSDEDGPTKKVKVES